MGKILRAIAISLITMAPLSSELRAQLIGPSAIEYETPGGLLVECRISYFMAPWSDIMGEWYAIIAPGLSWNSPSFIPQGPSGVPISPWAGVGIPYGLEPQWLCNPLPSPSGPIINPWPPFGASGEAIPSPSIFGGCSFGFASYGPPVGGPSVWLWRSGPIPVARLLLPPAIGSMRGAMVFFAGWTSHSPGTFRFWGAWGQVQ